MDTAESLASPDELREQIEATRASLAGKLETLESEVRQGVDGASESVKATVTEIKEAFRPSNWFEARPWTCLGASVTAGLIAGVFLRQRSVPVSGTRMAMGETSSGASGEFLGSRTLSNNVRSSENNSTGLKEKFAPEINSLKKMAVGAVVGVIGEVLKSSLPIRTQPELGRIIDSVADKVKRSAI